MHTDSKEPIKVSLKSKDDVYAAYMSFVKEGALFVSTKRKYELGEKVTIRLDLMEEPEILEFTSEIIWITPVGAQGGMAAGIGVRFEGEVGARINKKMSTYTAGLERSDKSTDTL